MQIIGEKKKEKYLSITSKNFGSPERMRKPVIKHETL
jgi:hypothetical protein